jgi:S-adenosylmethionine synthetase
VEAPVDVRLKVMTRDFVFSSESVTEGHPDKLCDRISDALVGQYLRRDRLAHINVECAVSTGILFIAVKAASAGAVDIPSAARAVIRAAGYDGSNGFNARDCTVMTSISEIDLPAEIRIDEEQLSDDDLDTIPARDQVTVFGFACDQTSSLMPLPIWLAHRLARRLTDVRRDGSIPYLLPDGKTQVAVEFRDRRPTRIHSVTILTAHREAGEAARVRRDIVEAVVAPVFADEPLRPDRQTRIDVNPDGAAIGGGPATHSGLTGRKTAVDTYGEYARHSGAALSGKDPSRVDRIGAYAARYMAKNVVAAGLARECELQLSYSVGMPRPVSVHLETFGTHTIEEGEIEARVTRVFDFRPAAITKELKLRALPGAHADGFYVALAAYGHMGRLDRDLPWERTDRVPRLRE